jgi:hypothetical protein
MSMHTSPHHQDYFASSFDGSYWPAVFAAAAIAAIAVLAWMTG